MRSLAAFLILLMLWVVGLLTFAERVERSTPAPEPAAADGIVALTGGATERITAGLKLLEREKGRRLLVSGVNPEVTRSELQVVAGAARGLFDCCVQLGFEAADTRGNAAETAAWVRSVGYDSLIVVTADYHMPRSLLEMQATLPGVELTPFPVDTDDLDSARWWRSGDQARRLIVEYNKYLAILAREMFLSLGPEDQEDQTAL